MLQTSRNGSNFGKYKIDINVSPLSSLNVLMFPGNMDKTEVDGGATGEDLMTETFK